MSFGASAAPLPTDAGPQAPFANASNRSWRMDGAGFAPSAPEHASSLNDRMAELYEVSARSIPPTGRRAPATWPWRVHAIRRGWWTGARGGWGPVSAANRVEGMAPSDEGSDRSALAAATGASQVLGLPHGVA